jgi:CheY-like chemotaxis protein
MPGGGTLEFGAEKVYVVDSVARAHPQLTEGYHAVISVRDTGIGMDADTQARALEPFFTTREGKQGTGLGLAIVHRIVQDNGGGLELESAPGQGTTVRCFLPLVAESPIAEATRSRTAGSGAGQRILLIDDEPSLAEAGRLRLERLGYKPKVTSSVRQAIEWVKADSDGFDAVVTDYLMPEMNGLDLSRELTRLSPEIPILMFTGYIEDFDDDLLRETGVRKLLQKPATLVQLDAALGEILGEAAGDGPSESGH